MIRSIAFPLAVTLAAFTPAVASAQAGGSVPIQRDLKREEKVDRRLGVDDKAAVPDGPGVSPGNPSGVPGFDGPPGTVGDSVGSYSPLPPGAPGNDRF